MGMHLSTGLCADPFVPQSQLNIATYCRKHGIVLTAFGSLSPLQAVPWYADRAAQIGMKHQKSAGQVMLRWAVQRGLAVIPGSNNPNRIRENLSLFDFHLASEEMQILDEVPHEQRYLKYPQNDPTHFI